VDFAWEEEGRCFLFFECPLFFSTSSSSPSSSFSTPTTFSTTPPISKKQKTDWLPALEKQGKRLSVLLTEEQVYLIQGPLEASGMQVVARWASVSFLFFFFFSFPSFLSLLFFPSGFSSFFSPPPRTRRIR
jgi:hypothetical protein